MKHLVKSNFLVGFNSLVTELDGVPAALLREFKIQPGIETQPNAFIPAFRFSHLLEQAAQRLACPDFALRLSRRQGLSMLGPIAVLARNAQTVQSAYDAIVGYFHLVTPAISLSLDDSLSSAFIRLNIRVEEPGLVVPRQFVELFVGNGHSLTQLLAGGPVSALAMHFPHSRIASLSVYEDYFGCPVHFDQGHCAVDLSISMMQRQISGADRETAKVAAEYLALKPEPQSESLTGRVRHLIRKLLPMGASNIRTVSGYLSVHPRTLQRQLARDGHTFEKLLDSERESLAIHYLTETRLPLAQVTGLLGYSDQPALNRACHRWFARTPKQIRN